MAEECLAFIVKKLSFIHTAGVKDSKNKDTKFFFNLFFGMTHENLLIRK